MVEEDIAKKTLGWGTAEADGSEFWDARPIFVNQEVSIKERLMLLFYPKKWFLYSYIQKEINKKRKETNLLTDPYRILDVGCGTGAAVIEMKKLFGREVEVVGLDVIKVQLDIARQRAKEYGVTAEFHWYDGKQFPFSNHSFDAVYSSDVLGHVQNVPFWLDEIQRVLRPSGVIALFAESKLGRHAFLRKWLLKQGVNTDPHAQFHISLYSKQELRELLLGAGFIIEKMYTAVWAKLLVHPDELYPALNKQVSFLLLPFKWMVSGLYWIKRKLHPYSTAACELYSLIEMCLVGKWIESQGYVILGKTNRRADLPTGLDFLE